MEKIGSGIHIPDPQHWKEQKKNLKNHILGGGFHAVLETYYVYKYNK